LSANTAPQTADPIPPISNHNVLFVGDPLNVRDKVELAEFEASIPYTIRAMPIASNANPMALFIIIFGFFGLE